VRQTRSRHHQMLKGKEADIPLDVGISRLTFFDRIGEG
jgi:hypothetical protein